MPVMLSSVHSVIVLECSAIRAYVQQKKEMLHLVVFSGYSVIIKVSILLILLVCYCCYQCYVEEKTVLRIFLTSELSLSKSLAHKFTPLTPHTHTPPLSTPFTHTQREDTELSSQDPHTPRDRIGTNNGSVRASALAVHLSRALLIIGHEKVPYVRTLEHLYVHTLVQTFTHTLTHAYTHAYTNTYTHTHTHTHTHIHTHTPTHTHTHTYVHIHYFV